VIREAIKTKLADDRRILNPAMGIVCLLMLAITFRWWPAVVAPISAVLVAAVTVLGGMAIAGQPLTVLTNVLTPLLLVVGLSGSVHLVGRYREELRHESNRQIAGQRTVRTMLSACFLASVTTAFGFASLATGRTPELRVFGITAAAGVMLAYLTNLLFVPAFITLVKAPPVSVRANSGAGPLERGVALLGRWVIRRSKWVAALSAVATVLLGYASANIQADARLLDAFTKDDPIHQITDILEEKLSGIRPLHVMLEAKDGSLLTPDRVRAVEQLEAWTSKQSGVVALTGYVEPLRHLASRMPAPGGQTTPLASQEQIEHLASLLRAEKASHFSEFATADHRHARFTVYLKDFGVRRSLELIDEMETFYRLQLPSGVEFALTGEAYVGSVGRERVLGDLLGGFGLALFVIFGLLTVLFKSVRFGLAAIPSNVIPLLATGAYMMWRDIDLNIATAITFSISTGLSVDDTIHVVARLREERQRCSSINAALFRTFRGTGRSIVVTSLSLSAGFAVLMLSNFVSVRQFGELIVVSVLNGLVAALILQPAFIRFACSKVTSIPKLTSPEALGLPSSYSKSGSE
jgi:predicted RND superfamily exporter protein